MTYKETLDYLFAQLPMFHRIGAAAYKADLNNTHAIMEMLDHPEKDFRCIHIAGTNGKGSTSNMLAAILQQSGYKTGLYTSPHLRDFRERIRIDGKMIGQNDVITFVKKYRKEFEAIEPSFFEWTVGLAFDYFSKKDVDIAVIETGLGGRLDSTNVVTPLVSVITNVQWDHMSLLGDTLKKIGVEKAGIIKKEVPVVIGQTQKETASIFKTRAKKMHAPIFFADKNFKIELSNLDADVPGKIEVDVTRKKLPYLKNLVVDLGGWYQTVNVATTLQTCEILEEKGFELNRKNIRKALMNIKKLTGFAGRWQVLGKNPLIIADTGHNVDGLKLVVQQIKATPHKHLHFVMGMVQDKDISKALALLPVNATYYFCKPDIPRGLDAMVLREQAANFKLKGSIFPSVKKALDAAIKKAGKNDLIFVGGSTFVVAEIV
jgi:dihydrofolate synthase / folylpolyglutamate synthase